MHFTDPSSKKCQRLAPKWEELAQAYEEDSTVSIAKVSVKC